jgi:hypothetical protein
LCTSLRQLLSSYRHLIILIIPIIHTILTMSPLTFLIGSNASTISVHTYDPVSKTISLVKTNTVTKTPSWIEKSRSRALAGNVFYSLSEGGGKALSLAVDAESGEVKTTATVGTFGNPAHGESEPWGVSAAGYLADIPRPPVCSQFMP